MAKSTHRPSRQTILNEGPRVRRWVLAVGAAGVPLFFLRSTHDPFNVPKLSLLIVVVGLASCIRLAEVLQGGSVRGLSRLAVPAAAVGLPLVIAWLASPYKYWALFGAYGRFQGLIPYLVVILLGVLIADAFQAELPLLAWILSLAGGIAGAYAVVQYIGLDPFTWTQAFGGETNRTSTLGNPNFTGGFLAMVLPLAAALCYTEPYSLRARKIVVAIIAGLILSFSQGPYAAGFAGAAVFVGLLLSSRSRWWKRVGLLTVGGIALVVAGTVLFAMVNPRSEHVPSSIAQRALWWRGAISMAADHPVVGRGPNAYAVEGSQYRPVDDAAFYGLDFSNDVHSVPLTFLTAAGALGLLGFLVLVGWVVSQVRTTNGDHLLRVGFLAAGAAYLVQSLVSIDEITLRTTLWAVIGGLAASSHRALTTPRKDKTASTTRRSPRVSKARVEKARFLPGLALIAAAGVTLVWWGAGFIVNDARVRSGLVAFGRGQPERGQIEFDRAIAFRGDYHYRHQNAFYAGQVAVERGERGREWFEEARRAYSYLDAFPHVPSLVDQARLLLAYSEFDHSLRGEAADVYLRLTQLDSQNLPLLIEAVEALEKLGRTESVELLEARIDRLNAIRFPE